MSVLWSLFKKDLKAVTAFPRFEILLGIFTFTFVGMSMGSVIQGRGARYCWTCLSVSDFVKTYGDSFSWFLSSFVFVLVPLLATDIISGEYERGTLLALVTYPVRRREVLTSKFLAAFLFCSTMLVLPFFGSILLGSYFNGLAIDPKMLLGYLAGLTLMSFLLCSVATLVSVLSRRLLVSALAFIGISLCWRIAVEGLAITMNLSELRLYAYIETARQLISLIISQESLVLFSKEQILAAVAVQLTVSALCLGLAYWLFERREFR
jgi:ABC-type transport system involved in multi-copper enzyme maturation permease subunit